MQIATRVSAGLFVGALLALPVSAVDMHCVDRDGRCMAVTVNGQKAVKLDKATKKLLAGIKGDTELRYNVSQARYQVPTPIRGDLDVTADRSADSKDWFGDNRQVDVMVVPLAAVELKTHQQLGTASGVSIEGSAPLTVANVLEGKRLPPGPYLLIVRLSGDGNWDRMTLYVQVAE